MKKCIFNEKKLCDNCGECDICDLNKNKVCDNCGKCLEAEGVDIKAIKIEEISKNVEENKVIEEEFLEINEDAEEEEVEEGDTFEAIDSGLELEDTEENSDDLWDKMEYIEDLDESILSDDSNLTEEYYPGLIRLKRVEE